MILVIENLFNGSISHLTLLSRKKVRWVRSDGRGEHVCRRLHEWFSERGIVHELSFPYSPESNDRTARLNRNLLDMARSMLMGLNVPNRERYWAEGLNCANYVRNRLHTSSCKEVVTPFKVIHGKQTNLAHLRIFGSKALVHVPNTERKGKLHLELTLVFLAVCVRGCHQTISRGRPINNSWAALCISLTRHDRM